MSIMLCKIGNITIFSSSEDFQVEYGKCHQRLLSGHEKSQTGEMSLRTNCPVSKQNLELEIKTLLLPRLSRWQEILKVRNGLREEKYRSLSGKDDLKMKPRTQLQELLRLQILLKWCPSYLFKQIKSF